MIIDFAAWKGHCVFYTAHWQGWCCCAAVGLISDPLAADLYSGVSKFDSWPSCVLSSLDIDIFRRDLVRILFDDLHLWGTRFEPRITDSLTWCWTCILEVSFSNLGPTTCHCLSRGQPFGFWSALSTVLTDV